MSDLDIDLLRRIAALEQRLGQVYDQVWATYVPLQSALAETGGGLAGGALNVGTYTVGPVGGGATYSFAYPSTSKAIKVRLTAIWAAASNSSAAYCRPNGATASEASAQARALVANISSDAIEDVTLDATGKAQLIVTNANTTYLLMLVLGYYL